MTNGVPEVNGEPHWLFGPVEAWSLRFHDADRLVNALAGATLAYQELNQVAEVIQRRHHVAVAVVAAAPAGAASPQMSSLVIF